MKRQRRNRKAQGRTRVVLLIFLLSLGLVIGNSRRVSAQEGFQPGVGGFVDEDGDGFNDLLPDHDGDGIPDALDPDFKGHNADSIYLQRQNQEQHQFMWQHMNQDADNMMHGEPGMFGPGDSTSHGGMHDGGMGGGMGGGGMNGGGGMGPGGGSPPNEGGGSGSNEGGMGGDTGGMGGSGGGMGSDGGSGGNDDDPGSGGNGGGMGGPGGG